MRTRTTFSHEPLYDITPRLASGSRCSTLTVQWSRSAGAMDGFCGQADAAVRQRDGQSGHLLRGTRRHAMDGATPLYVAAYDPRSCNGVATPTGPEMLVNGERKRPKLCQSVKWCPGADHN
jgi:hypothetical protein